MFRSRSRVIALAALLSSSLSLPALAQEPSAQESRDKARAALEAGDVAAACLAFEQSYQASKAPGSTVQPDDALFELAACHDKQGKKAAASAEFEQLAAGGGPRAEEAKARVAA